MVNNKILGIVIVVRRLFLTLFLISFASVVNAKYELTAKDITARNEIEKSISKPGAMHEAFSSSLNVISSCTPDFLKRGFLGCASYVIKKTLNSRSMRNELRYLAFGADNGILTQYDFIVSPQETIPEQPISVDVLDHLLENAKNERTHWDNGKMSGGIYDGHPRHMENLAQFFKVALKRDLHNLDLFSNENTLALAAKAFLYFQTANPLHGNLFPLAQKSMRELGQMFASLVNKQHAIVTSGGEEALRIALRALKNRYRTADNEQCLIYTVNDHKKRFIKNIASTLNIKTTEDPQKDKNAHFAVIYVTNDNLDILKYLGPSFKKRGLDLHIHFDNHAFRRLFLDHDNYQLENIFELFSSTKSVSFDTEGLFYQGISATVFVDAEHRFDAFEAHVHWSGGIYPGITSAGSLPGIDYIIAYLATLSNGKKGLGALAKEPRHSDAWVLLEDLYQGFKKIIINQFENNLAEVDVDIFLKMRSIFLPYDWQKLMERLLIDTTLNVFDASSENFSGQITSGGTESIRLAIQTYFNRFKKLFPEKKPIFLMTEKAHIAFDRHMKDLDCEIVRIKEEANAMSRNHLEEKIAELKPENIAAIVASTPNYPIGTSDSIREIAAIAKKFGVLFHVDGCLGSFIMQFLENNPVRINFRDSVFAGITSWSADLHKFALTQKGLSFIGFRKRKDLEMPTSICKKRSSSQLEVALRCMLSIGRQGYEDRANSIVKLAQKFKAKLLKINKFEVIENASDDIPHFVIAFGLKEPHKHLTYTLEHLLKKLGWHLSLVNDNRVHIAITNAHTYNKDFVPKFISDTKFVVDLLINKHPNLKQSASVGLYGMAASPRGLSLVADGLKDQFLTGMLRLYAENLVE